MRTFILLFLLLFWWGQAPAADLEPSGFSLYSGGEFYVLTDGVFSTDQTIQVRFEAAGQTRLSEYGGVDVRLYRIPKPLEFLKAQKNLHRPSVKATTMGASLANALSYLWDSWYKKTRLAWQRIFSADARKTAVATAPRLQQAPAHSYHTKFTKEPQFEPLRGFELVDSFRYPVWQAKPNQPPKDTRLEGSSSEFITTPAGNVILPLGKRKPGLYLVEAMIGSYRATTLAFVSDSVLVTKVSSQQMMTWAVNRTSGVSRPGGTVVLTDGVGVLEQGTASADGVFIAKRSVPERTFAMLEDKDGGVAMSENFFYDSEVYQPKVYLFTDRPLYQPGDSVWVRALGRNLERQGAKDLWTALKGNSAKLTVVDSTGVELLTQKVAWDEAMGGEAQFRLPDSAESGGYSLKLALDGESYGAAFRVARFTKPHFDAQIIFDRPTYKVGEPVKGRVVLTYPSGQPVVGAEVDLQLRSEQMSMFEGSYAYGGAMPVELKEQSYKSNGKGEFEFSFPPATKPARYIASARALDGAAFRVSTKKVILIEGYLESYLLKADFNATEPGATLKVSYDRQGKDAGDAVQPLTNWQAIRLEDRTVLSGKVDASDRGEFAVKFEKPGHYILRVVDAGGVTRGTRSHVVLGPDLKSSTGQLELLADRDSYAIGETASVILTFPFKADDALLTLERSDVSAVGRLMGGADWFRAKRLSDAQWKIEIPIRENHAPNIIFSVAYARNGEFGFQNKGLAVKKPMIDITFKADKPSYMPGDKVVVDVETRLEGQPISSLVALGVVDEMIYVLQPEIVPPIGEFFHYQRRNQVRTTSSLSFYSFNPAVSESGAMPGSAAGRDLKVLQERARRDARDTAYWNGRLKTDENGRARFEFVMPDALTRWRITGRAMALAKAQAGVVGEAKGFVTSNKDYYLKWTGPTRFRAGDKPKPALVAFNSTTKPIKADVALKGASYSFTRNITMNPGANTVVLESAPEQTQIVEASIAVDGKRVDALETDVLFAAPAWTQTRSQLVALAQGAKLSLPSGASHLRLKVMPDSAAQFLRIADDLLEYPWGCVEQTSSRIIPLTMALSALEQSGSPAELTQRLRDRVAAERRRLIAMAGENAAFTWWGDMTGESLLLTAHAYHADWRASRLLGIEYDKANGEHLLKLYADAKDKTLLGRAYALWVLSRLGMPVAEQVKSLAKELVGPATKPVSLPVLKEVGSSVGVVMDEAAPERALSILILGGVALKNKIALEPAFKSQLDSLAQAASSSPSPSPVFQAASLVVRTKAKGGFAANTEAEKILEAVRIETPTIDRALTLALVEEALPIGFTPKTLNQAMELGGSWVKASKGPVASYVWKGGGKGTNGSSALPTSIELPSVSGAVAEAVYESPEEAKSTLPASVSRRLYRLKFATDTDGESEEGVSMEATEVKAGESLDSRALYLDEITIAPKGALGRFMLLEVPLPPGGEAEESTWGLEFKGIDPQFREAKASGTGMGYSIPLETLNGETKIHHLVRFASRGQFKLPPAKLFKMYRPTERAYQGESGLRVLTVE
jgi:hypothetical protein